MMNRATVYQRQATIIVHPSSCTTDGVWILSEPCTRLSTDCSDAELGRAVASALEASMSPVPHPTQWTGILQPLLKAAGVKSWTTFAKGAVCAQVEKQDGRLELVPTMNLGADEGFQMDESKRERVSLPASLDVVGARLRGVLASAR